MLLANLISIRYKGKDKGKKRKKDKKAAVTTPQQEQQKKLADPEGINFSFCGTKGFGLACSKVNLTLTPRHTWWIDFGITTHIKVSMQDCLNCRKLNDGERYIYVSNGKKVEVEAIENFRSLLKSGFYLDTNIYYSVF